LNTVEQLEALTVEQARIEQENGQLLAKLNTVEQERDALIQRLKKVEQSEVDQQLNTVVEQTDVQPPKTFDGWTVQQDRRGYYRLARKIEGARDPHRPAVE
jgi:uncharacterized protein YhaN